MKAKRILSVFLVLIFVLTACPFALAENTEFTIEYTTPGDGARGVSPVDLKVDVVFSEAPDPATLTADNIEVSDDALGSIVAKEGNLVTVYLRRSAVYLGDTYSITFKEGIKSLTGHSLKEEVITIAISSKVPRYRQITNGDMSDVYFDGAYEGDYLGGDFLGGYIYINDNPALKYVPWWEGATARQRVYIAPGRTYTARARVWSDKSQGIGFALSYAIPGSDEWYHIAPKVYVTEGEWADITYTWTIPEDAQTDKNILYIASERSGATVFIDDWQFFEGINDIEEPEEIPENVTTTISESADPMAKAIALGLLSDEMNSQANVTKIELAEAIVGLLGFDLSNLTSDGVIFEDVSEDDRAIAGTVINMGLMDGKSETEFGPNDSVSVSYAIEVIMKAIGYKPALNDYGSYALMAAESKVSDGIEISNKELTVAELAALLDNTLDARILKANKYPATGVVEYAKGDTVLEEYLGFKTDTGVIDGTSKTLLWGESSLKDTQISIDGKAYNCYADMNQYLGCKVEYYYKQKGSVREILYITGINDINKIADMDTSEGDLKYDSGTYRYVGDDNKEKVYRLSGDKNIIYNGKYYKPDNDNVYVPDCGSVRIVGYGSSYTTVIINDLRTITADAIDTHSMSIYSSNLSKPLNLRDCEVLEVYDKFGFKRDFGYIKIGDVLSVAQSYDNTMVKIYVSSDTVSGTITEITETERELTVTVTDSLGQTNTFKILKGAPGYEDIYLGKIGTFRLDHTGRIAAYSGKKTDKKVGYLVDALAERGLKSTTKFKIFSEDGEMLELDGADRIKVDTVSYKDGEKVIEALKKDTKEVVSQLVLYDVNEDGKLTFIDTAYNKLPNCGDYRLVTPESGDSKDGFKVTYSSVLPPNTSPVELTFYTASRSFDNKVHLSSSPKIFVVPHKAKTDDEEKFNIITNYWDLGYGFSNCIEAYSLNPASFETEYLVIFLTEEYWHINANAGDDFGIVQDIRSVMIDDEAVTKITFTNERSCYTDNSSWLGDADIGDYLCYRTDKNGKLTRAILKFFDTATKTCYVGNPYGVIGDVERMIYANVYERQGSLVRVVLPDVSLDSPEDVAINSTLVDISRANIYRYNPEINKVEQASAADVLDYVNAGSDYSGLLMVTCEGFATHVLITD